MKNYLEFAQNLLDEGETVPDEILLKMDYREREIILNIIKIKETLNKEFDISTPVRDTIVINPTFIKKRISMKLLYSAAALFIIGIYFPISESIETRTLLKEETAEFVEALFEDNYGVYSPTGYDSTEEWFSSSILPDL